VVTVVVMFFVVKAATSTTWVQASDKVSPAQLTDAQAALEKAGIESRVSDLGALEVPKERAAEAAGKLAEAQIAGAGGHTTCEQMGSKGSAFMASTSEQQRQNNRSCLQNEIANMVESVGPVESAQVTLTLPETELFTEEQTDAKASITVDTQGQRLADGHVRAITALAVNSAKGLNTDNVAITDDSGHLYSGDDAGGDLTAAQLKLKVQATRNQQIEQKLLGQFEDIAGKGKVKVISNVELDMDTIQREVKDVGGPENERGPLVSRKYEDEVLRRADEATGGTAGTGTNINGEEGGVIGDADETGAGEDRRLAIPVDGEGDGAGYTKLGAAETFSNDEVREAISVAQGAVKENRLAIVLDTSVKPETANAVKSAAMTYLGGNAEDSFSLDQADIAKLDEERATTQRFEGVTGYVKWALLGLGLIGMAFFVRRTLNQRTQELLYPMDDMLQLEPAFEPIPLKELEAAVAGAQSNDNQKRLELERKVAMIADQKPGEVAQMLRGWLHDTDGNYKRSA
jgi:flagellar M-ring protein FliF